MNTDIKKLKIAVFGDIMLDRYLTGVVERISPEAPVPINRIQNDRSVLGGAANTAANLSTLGCQVHMVGRIGNDQAGKMFESFCIWQESMMKVLLLVITIRLFQKSEY